MSGRQRAVAVEGGVGDVHDGPAVQRSRPFVGDGQGDADRHGEEHHVGRADRVIDPAVPHGRDDGGHAGIAGCRREVDGRAQRTGGSADG